MIDKKTVEHLAKLARLEISDEEKEDLSQQLSKVFSYFEEIEKVDTKGVEPLVTPTDIEVYWREDNSSKDFSTEELLANAPDKTGHLFKVPPVI